MSPGPLLLRKGRVLTPRSRLRYRLARVRVTDWGLDELTVGVLIARFVTLPFLTIFDVVAWPVARRTLGRGSWWVVEVRFHGPDAEFVRIAEASTQDEATAKRTEIADARGRRAGASPSPVPRRPATAVASARRLLRRRDRSAGPVA